MTAAARRVRDNIRFVAGLAGLAYEMAVEHSDRPVLLGVFAGMIGLDVIAADVFRRSSPPKGTE